MYGFILKLFGKGKQKPKNSSIDLTRRRNFLAESSASTNFVVKHSHTDDAAAAIA
jgi:hypothetical protein